MRNLTLKMNHQNLKIETKTQILRESFYNPIKMVLGNTFVIICHIWEASIIEVLYLYLKILQRNPAPKLAQKIYKL